MIDYTRAAIDKTVNDFKKFAYFFNIAAQGLSIIYLIYAIIVGSGYLYANIALCAVSFLYSVFYIVTYGNSEKKKERKTAKRAYKWFQLVVKAFSLGVAIYGIYIATEHTTLVSIVMAAMNVISWTLQVIITVTLGFIESKVNFIVTAIEADIENVMRPVEKVGNFIKKVRGQEIEQKEAPSKTRLLLENTVLKYREKKKIRKAEKKEAKRRRNEKDFVKPIAPEEKEKEKITK